MITPLFYAFAALYVFVSLATFLHVPHAHENIARYPVLWLVPILNALAVLNIPRAMHRGKPGYAFFTSSMVISYIVIIYWIFRGKVTLDKNSY